MAMPTTTIPLTGTGFARPAKPAEARISSVKILGPNKVRHRRPLALRVRVLNSGDATATGVRVKLTVTSTNAGSKTARKVVKAMRDK